MSPRARVSSTRPSRSASWLRPEKRHAIYDRDEFLCAWCGCRITPATATVDHLYPRGHTLHSNDPEVLVTACFACNSSRKDADPWEYLEHLAVSGQDTRGILVRLHRRHHPLDLAVGRDAWKNHRWSPSPKVVYPVAVPVLIEHPCRECVGGALCAGCPEMEKLNEAV